MSGTYRSALAQVVLAVVAIPGVCAAASIRVNQPPAATGGAPFSAVDGQQAADNWYARGSWTLGRARWWGAYANTPAGTAAPAIDDFALVIYDSVLVFDPFGGSLPYFAPGNPVHTSTLGNAVDRTLTGLSTTAGNQVFRYEASLTTPFKATFGESYWFSLLNQNSTTGQPWGWYAGIAGDGRHSFRPTAADTWLLASDKDLALQVLSVPEPATIVLLGCGLAAAASRRRRAGPWR